MKALLLVLLLMMSTLAQAGKYTYVPILVDMWDVCNSTDRCAKAEDAIFDAATWEVVTDITADNTAYFAQKSGTRDFESQIGMQMDTTCNYLWLRAKGSGVVWLQTTPFGPVPSNTRASVLFNGATAATWTWTPIGNRSDENLQRVNAGSSVPINDVAQRDFAFTPGTTLYVLAQPSVQLDSWFCSTNANATPVSPGGSAGVSANYSLYEVTTEPSIDDAQWDRASVVPKTGFTTTPAADMEIKAVWKAGTPSRMCVRGEETLANLYWIDVSTDATELGSYTAVFAYFKMNNLDRVLDINTWLLGVSPQPDYYDATWPAGVFSTASDLANIAVTQSTSGNRRRMQACFDTPQVITTGAQWLCDFRQNERITGGSLESRNAFNPTNSVSSIANWGVCAAGVMLPGPPVDNTPPSVGLATFSNVTSTSFTVTATASDGETGISACAVVYDTTNDNSVTFGVDPSVQGTMSGGVCSATINGLTPGTAYEAAVYAVNGVGLSTTGAVGDQTTTSSSSATFYVSTTGSGSTCSSAAPCALSRLVSTTEPRPSPGETWIIKNGTYAMNTSNAIHFDCSAGGNALNGTSSNRITIQAETSRQAWLKGDGLEAVLQWLNCNYWTIDGLRISARDNNLAGSGLSTVQMRSSHNFIFTNNLLHHANRFGNMSLLQNGDAFTTASNNNTFIKNEFYYFHRYGLISKYSTGTIARLNYCNARGYMDIPKVPYGGYPSGITYQGDACERSYPGSDTITESNIAEQSGNGFSPEPSSDSYDNRYYGNIHIDGDFGTIATGKAGGHMTFNLYYKDNLLVNPVQYGFYMRSGRNTVCEQCTVIGGQRAYVYAVSAETGPAPRSMFLTNVLAVSPTVWGLYFAQTNLEAWQVSYMAIVGALGGSGSFSPALGNANIDHSFTQPANQMGNCRVWVPESASFLKRQGLNGKDIGAEVLYLYVNEAKTTTKLWNRTTGAWIGAGATINGTNPPFSPTVWITNADINTVTDSAADVGSRLNILASGCLPFDY